MSRVFNLANIFQFIDNSLNDSTFAEQDFIGHMHKTVFHVLSQFGYQVDPINEELLEKGLGNVPFISEQFTVDPREQIGSGKGLSVINIAGSKHKIKNLSLVVDDKMHLQSKEPSYAAVTLGGKSFENFVGVLAFDMTGSYWSRIDKRYAGTFTQTLGLKEYNQGQKNRM